MQNVVFNGHYLTYCDVCLTEYWRAIGLRYPDGFSHLGCDVYARKITVEYHAPALYDDDLDVCGRVARLGRSSLSFAVGIYRRGETERSLVDSELVYVCVDPATRRPMPWPAAFRDAVRHYEPFAPIEASGAR